MRSAVVGLLAVVSFWLTFPTETFGRDFYSDGSAVDEQFHRFLNSVTCGEVFSPEGSAEEETSDETENVSESLFDVSFASSYTQGYIAGLPDAASYSDHLKVRCLSNPAQLFVVQPPSILQIVDWRPVWPPKRLSVLDGLAMESSIVSRKLSATFKCSDVIQFVSLVESRTLEKLSEKARQRAGLVYLHYLARIEGYQASSMLSRADTIERIERRCLESPTLPFDED